MDPGARATRTRDEHYNLVSVLYHALQAADACDQYALDAEAAGDERLAAFFREAQVAQAQVAERAKGLPWGLSSLRLSSVRLPNHQAAFLSVRGVYPSTFSRSRIRKAGRQCGVCLDPLRERGYYSRPLRPVVEIRQRKGLLPLRHKSPQRSIPHPAQPLSVRSAGAFSRRAYRGGGFASGADTGNSRRSLRSTRGSSAMPVRDAKRRDMAGSLGEPTLAGPIA